MQECSHTPPFASVAACDVDALSAFVRRYPKLFVLTGAGASTESGIPAYRDADGRWTRTAPVTLQEFLGSEPARRRYWRRSMAGWPLVAAAHPNRAHHGLARLEAMGHVHRLVTQNVDGLHQRAGATAPIELHGTAHSATCLDCGASHARATIQRWLEASNPHLAGASATSRPDGDAELDDDSEFLVPSCNRCGGVVKPDVVFFGAGVPQERVDAAREALSRADAMLVVGSSLAVYSGYRFCVWATERGTPIAAINLGRTRADPVLALKIEARCGATVSALVSRLASPPAAPPTPRQSGD